MNFSFGITLPSNDGWVKTKVTLEEEDLVLATAEEGLELEDLSLSEKFDLARAKAIVMASRHVVGTVGPSDEITDYLALAASLLEGVKQSVRHAG